MKISTLANFLIGSSLLFTTTAIAAEEKCNGKAITKTYNTKANTDRKNWNYVVDQKIVYEANSKNGDVFKWDAKDHDVLKINGNGYVQILVSSLSGNNLSICVDPSAAIDFFLDGYDSYFEEEGKVFVSGGNRSDFIFLNGNFTSSIKGNAGNDLLIGGRKKDSIDGGDGNDYIEGYGGGDYLVGGDGSDLISADRYYNDGMTTTTIDSGGGHDIVAGSIGKELVLGGSGNDLIILSGTLKRKDAIQDSTSTNNFFIPEFFDRNNWEYVDDDAFMDEKGGQVAGEDGHDIIYGSNGDDEISGGEGNDSIMSAKGNDTIFGDDGNDRIWAGSGNDEVYGMKGDDLIKGGSGNDFLFGNDDEDTIYGDNGDDLVSGDEGEDHLYGGSGNDVITLSTSTGNYVREGDRYRKTCGGLGGCIAGNPDLAVDLKRDTHGGDVDGGSGNDDIYGSQGNNDEDYLVGGSGQDVIWGLDGTNNIHGGDNDDYLIGGAGADDLYGDDGWDMCWGRGDAGCSD